MMKRICVLLTSLFVLFAYQAVAEDENPAYVDELNTIVELDPEMDQDLQKTEEKQEKVEEVDSTEGAKLESSTVMPVEELSDPEKELKTESSIRVDEDQTAGAEEICKAEQTGEGDSNQILQEESETVVDTAEERDSDARQAEGEIEDSLAEKSIDVEPVLDSENAEIKAEEETLPLQSAETEEPEAENKEPEPEVTAVPFEETYDWPEATEAETEYSILEEPSSDSTQEQLEGEIEIGIDFTAVPAEEPKAQVKDLAEQPDSQQPMVSDVASVVYYIEEEERDIPINAPETKLVISEEQPVDVLASAQEGNASAADYSRENSTRGFVYRLYKTVFQREPDQEGFEYWVNSLENGTSSAADTISIFFNSEEYRNSGKTTDQIVSDCYNTMLNREPDEGGFQYWKKCLDIGMTPQSLLVGFVYSKEFSQILSKYGVSRGSIRVTKPVDENFERTYFVYRLYENCLGRKPDAAGQEYWCKMLAGGGTGAQAAHDFFFSTEFNKNRYNNSTFVQLLYKAIQGREYDPEGLVYWTTRLNYFDTREKVLNGFIGSQEFRKQCTTAKISAGNALKTPDDTTEWQYNIKVLNLCNQYRREAGLADLYTREDLLWDLAMARANEITTQFSHTRPNGTSCFSLFREQGFYGHLGENIAAGAPYADPENVVEAWMNSAGHRANIMSTDYTYLATGYLYDSDAESYCADGKYQGTYQKFGAYSAQSFCNFGVQIK